MATIKGFVQSILQRNPMHLIQNYEDYLATYCVLLSPNGSTQHQANFFIYAKKHPHHQVELVLPEYMGRFSRSGRVAVVCTPEQAMPYVAKQFLMILSTPLVEDYTSAVTWNYYALPVGSLQVFDGNLSYYIDLNEQKLSLEIAAQHNPRDLIAIGVKHFAMVKAYRQWKP